MFSEGWEVSTSAFQTIKSVVDISADIWDVCRFQEGSDEICTSELAENRDAIGNGRRRKEMFSGC